MKKLRPLLKWTGGKFDEFALFAEKIPVFKRYVEPFFGGGGVFFALQPKVPSLINDKSTDLINFYTQISNEAFKKELFLYADAWERLDELTTFLWGNCAVLFINFIKKNDNEDELKRQLKQNLDSFITDKSIFKKEGFIINFELFKLMVVSSLVDKGKRIKRISINEKKNFNKDQLLTHFETGVRSGTYLFFRKLLNQHYTNSIVLSAPKAIANWYFIREFCYASMFRFNGKGEFNIPYGGIAYNKKKFKDKIERIFSAEVIQLFKQATFKNKDFESFLNEVKLTEDDFIFLDPPYDSEFSEYDQSAFNRKDQERLANFLRETVAKWMVVIKETPFIRELYAHKGINIATFEKKYAYNVRGRNNRGVTHLVITNY